ncbi:ABC transporter [Gordonia spumicola]|uniref:ABC transporter n=1 Tax=Gordonia spumicola TaxID=589161 RepID=A0A7I9V6P1_9ACTN|nr:ABC transporter ATP-binding protein [Gordonia spumicola]GEE01045.1 ABC transporter [Gordonia spumicola]
MSESPLHAHRLTVGYRDRVVIRDLTVDVPADSFTMIIGPNGCGKSTLLNAFARLLAPSTGRILLNGDDIARLSAKQIARRLSMLPQSAIVPTGVSVASLVARGRFPHQRMFQQWTAEDERAVTDAMAATETTDLADRFVDELSGGQRQRVWVAMLLAQQTDVMLLDEPTSFLDIAHQFDLLELLRTLHEQGRTQVVVLHDLNQAARYATHLIVMKDGAVVTTGRPDEVITADLVRDVFDLDAIVVPDPVTGTPSVVPLDPRGARDRP